MINVLGPRPQSVWSDMERRAGPRLRRPAVRQRRHPVRPERARSRAPDHARAVRRPQRDDRRARHRPQPDAAADRRRRQRGRQRLPHRPVNETDTHRRRRDHRPRRARPGRRARLRAHLVDPRPPRQRAGQPRQPGPLVRPGAADRRPDLADRGAAGDGPLAGRRRARPLDVSLARKIVDDRPADVARPLHRGRLHAGGADALRNAAQRRGRRRVQRHPEVPAQAAAAARTTAVTFTDDAVGAAAEGLPGRRLRLVEAGRRPAAKRRLADLPGRRRPTSSTAAGRWPPPPRSQPLRRVTDAGPALRPSFGVCPAPGPPVHGVRCVRCVRCDPVARAVHIRGTAYEFNNTTVRLGGATIRVAERPRISRATVRRNGSYDLVVPDRAKITPYITGRRATTPSHPPDLPDSRREPRPGELPNAADDIYRALARCSTCRATRPARVPGAMRDRVDVQHPQRPRPLLPGFTRLRRPWGCRGDGVRNSAPCRHPVYFNAQAVIPDPLQQLSSDRRRRRFGPACPPGSSRIRAHHPATRLRELRRDLQARTGRRTPTPRGGSTSSVCATPRA